MDSKVDTEGLRLLADNLRPEYPVTMEELDKALDELERLQREIEACRYHPRVGVRP